MHAYMEIDAGICGFVTKVNASANEDQEVTIEITSACEKIKTLGAVLSQHGPLDAYEELASQRSGRILANEAVEKCCVGCIVPCGVFKAMQVAAGLALPKDVVMRIEKVD